MASTDAHVRIQIKPTEFDLLREALSDFVAAHLSIAGSSSTADPSRKRESRMKAAQAQDLMRKISS